MIKKSILWRFFHPRHGGKYKKIQNFDKSFGSKKVDLPKGFEFVFFKTFIYSVFNVFEGFCEKRKMMFVFYNRFLKIFDFMIFENFKKEWCFHWKPEKISGPPRNGVLTSEMWSLAIFLQSTKNFIKQNWVEICFFDPKPFVIFLEKIWKTS